MDSDAERRRLARSGLRGSGTASRRRRGAQARPRRRIRAARRHAGLHAPGGRDREAISRGPGQAHLEPRGGPGARLLPADLAVQAQRGTGRERQAPRDAYPRVRPVDQRLVESGCDKGGQGRPAAPGPVERARRRAIRLHRAEPADRVRDAQHPRPGRTLARRQHQPERRVPRMLHGGSGARGRQGLARIPPRADGQSPEAPRGSDAAAEKAGWGNPLPEGVHRGIAQFMGYASYSAAIAEVSVSSDGKLKIHRMVLALNCGHAVNPDQIAAQVEGSVVYGLSAALYGEGTAQNGRIVELNLPTYPAPAP